MVGMIERLAAVGGLGDHLARAEAALEQHVQSQATIIANQDIATAALQRVAENMVAIAARLAAIDETLARLEQRATNHE